MKLPPKILKEIMEKTSKQPFSLTILLVLKDHRNKIKNLQKKTRFLIVFTRKQNVERVNMCERMSVGCTRD